VHTRVKLAAALLAAAAVLPTLMMPAFAPPAAADLGPGSGNGGSNTGGRFSAWAWYVAAGGDDGAIQTSDDCDLPLAPLEESHYEYFVTHSVYGDETIVSYVCVGALLRQMHPEGIPALEGSERDLLDVIWSGPVTPISLDDLVAHAVGSLDPEPPTIETDLRAGVDGLVNLPVRFTLTGDLAVPPGDAADNGVVRVVVSAVPHRAFPFVWHTGDGRQACAADDAPGVCTHGYVRSSNGERHDGLPRDHYRVTADVTYLGHYDVFVNGAPFGGADIGDIVRTAELPLAVDEAQAINTRG
jgi:hypothetical protein